MRFPLTKHSAIFYGTHCGKSTFAFDLLEGPYYKKFDKIIIVSAIDRRDPARLWMADKNVHYATTILESIDPISYSGEYNQLVILDAFYFEKEDIDIAIRVYSGIPKLSLWLLTRDIQIHTTSNFYRQLKWVVTFDTPIVGWFKSEMYISKKLQDYIDARQYTKFIHTRNKEIFIIPVEKTIEWKSTCTKITI